MSSTTLPPISLFHEVSSTNDLAMSAARDGAPHGSCWLAERQLGGRGRREVDGERRAWFSPSGVNLYMSVLVKLALPPEIAATLTLAAAVGVRRALTQVLDPVHHDALLIKWPNDLLLDGKKLCGILSEGVLIGGKLDAVIIGVGINVNLAREQLPEHLQSSATSLFMHTAQRYDRLALALLLREELLAAAHQLATQGLPTILEQWRPFDQTKGRRVRAMIGGGWCSGTSLGISETGGLLVELAPGDVEDVQTGEVVFDD